MITSKQRAYLRSLANKIDTILQIGKGGINENTITQISEALEARELIKVKCLETSPVSAYEAANEISGLINCEIVQVIGERFVLYKESVKHKRIVL